MSEAINRLASTATNLATEVTTLYADLVTARSVLSAAQVEVERLRAELEYERKSRALDKDENLWRFWNRKAQDLSAANVVLATEIERLKAELTSGSFYKEVDIDTLLKERDALREALTWYASPEAWATNEVEGPNGDYGKRARVALETRHE